MQHETSDKALQVEHYVDVVTGKPSARFLWNGLLINAAEISGSHVQKLAGLSLIAKDLRNAAAWFQRAHEMAHQDAVEGAHKYQIAKDREVFDDVKAFFIASVTFYGKCFTEAGGRATQMQGDWLEAKYRPAHFELMEIRHNLAAHSGDAKLEKTCSRILLIPEDGKFRPRLHHQRIQPDFCSASSDGVSYASLFAHAIEVVDGRHRKLADELGKIVTRYPNDLWINVAKSGQPMNLDVEYKRRYKKR